MRDGSIKPPLKAVHPVGYLFKIKFYFSGLAHISKADLNATINQLYFKTLLSELHQLVTEDYKEQLETHRPEIVQNMNLTEVISGLRRHKIFTPTDTDQISRAGGTDAQNERLLDYLLRKLDRAYGKLCDALWVTGQMHLEQLLRCDVLTVSA